MGEPTAATQHASRALAAIAQIPSAEDEPALLECMLMATQAIGGSASVYTASIPDGEAETLSFTLYACHPAYAQQQELQGPLVDHPWFRFACTHSLPGTEQQIRIQKASDAAAVELAKLHDFRSCLIVPVRSSAPQGRFEMLCVGSNDPAMLEGDHARVHRALARALAGELHDWLSRHLSARLVSSARLRDEDIELLRLEHQGLGTKEIAQRTGWSMASVDSRFQRLNARLACATRKASARRAAAYGLLEER